MKIKFSIGIPAYKSSFLIDCIDSILSQTYDYFELIIVNDCSPFPLDQIVDSYIDPRIRYFKNEKNFGAEHVVDNWNRCLKYADGEFFILMGDDDVMKPDFLQEFLNLILRYPTLDLYHCRSVIIDEVGLPKRFTNSWPEYETVYENMWHRNKELRVQYISEFVYRTSTLKKNGGFFKLPLAWASDDISSYIACGSKGVAHTNTPIFCYRESTNTISNSGNRKLKMNAILLEEAWLLNFLKEIPQSQNDIIIHRDLLRNVKKFIQKKKIRTMALGMSVEGLITFGKWYKISGKFQFSLKELVYAGLESLKLQAAKKAYGEKVR